MSYVVIVSRLAQNSLFIKESKPEPEQIANAFFTASTTFYPPIYPCALHILPTGSSTANPKI